MTDHGRRKALIDAYKRAFPPMGIYRLHNVESGRMLIDQSANTTAALNRHRTELRLGTHRIRALQEDWRRQGEAGFAFDVLHALEERPEPSFDYAAELARLLAPWRELIPPGSKDSYL